MDNIEMSNLQTGSSRSLYSACDKIAPMRVDTSLSRLHVLVAILEGILLCFVAVGAYYLRFTTVFPVHSHDVLCTNPALMDSLPDPKTMLFTLTDRVFYLFLMSIPLMLMLVIETLQFCCKSHIYKDVGEFLLRLAMLARRVVRFYGAFILGVLVCSITADLMKLISGQPRPYFLTKLRDSCCQTLYGFCHALKSERDVYMSFPSFRATTASFAAVFSASYVHFVLGQIRCGKFLRTILVALLMLMPVVVIAERIMANKNHLIDLGAGLVLGTIIGLYLSLGVMRRFSETYIFIEPIEPSLSGTHRVMDSSLDSTVPLPPTPPPANIRSLIPRLYTDRMGDRNTPYTYGVVNENLNQPSRQRRDPILAFEKARQNGNFYSNTTDST